MSVSTLEASYQLSPMQQGMLFHNLYAPQSGVFIQQVIGDLREELDVAAFRRAWQRVVDRHPIVRTSFRWEGLDEPVQDANQQVVLPMDHQDWRGLPRLERDYRLELYLKADRRRGFELAQAPLMRLALFRLDEAHYQFVWTSHHALLDNHSRLLVLREAFAFYEAFRAGRDLDLPLPRPFADYIDWLRSRDDSEAEAFWRDRLAGFTAPTPLVLSRAPGQILDSEEDYAEQELRLPGGTTSMLRRLAEQNDLDLATLVRGVWGLILARYAGERDVIIGEARSCGRSAIEGGESMVGLFLTTVPVRIRTAPTASAIDWLRGIRDDQARAAAYEHAPLSRIQQWSEVPRGAPLFESVVIVDGDFAGPSPSDGLGSVLGSGELRFLEQTNFPLAVSARIAPDLRVTISYDRRRFDDACVTRMLGHVRTIMEGIAEHPEAPLGTMTMLTHAERQRLLVEWNDTARQHPKSESVEIMVSAIAATQPERTAMSCEGESLTYGELDARSSRLAHRLRALGVGPDTRVALAVERSTEIAVGVLGILKAGAAWVPIDASYPADRIALVLEDASPAAMVLGSGHAELPGAGMPVVRLDDPTLEQESDAAFDAGAGPDDLAYVIYTSGSTGRPKGVMITRGNLSHYVQAIREPLGITADDRYLHTASIAFSSSVRQLLVPLTIGATVVVATRDRIGNPRALFSLVKGESVTVMDLVPSYWQNCIQVLEGLDAAERASLLDNDLRLIVSASEPLPSDLPVRWSFGLRHGARLINMFGQTETTGIATVFPIPYSGAEGERIVRIGYPIANTRLYVLDANGHAAPIGVTGELCVAGAGVGRGYLNQPELTAERFVPDPFFGDGKSRMYRTGDRARFLPDGSVEFAGRGDNQVKIRGFRVEVEEVEGALLRHEGIAATVVTAREHAGDRRLVAYIVPAGHSAPAPDALRAALKRTLPDYMVPSAFVTLSALPRTPNGKVDRAALPEPDFSNEGIEGFRAPRTPLEEIVAGVWQDILGVDRIGAADDFFALGGHSLMAIRVLSRLRGSLGVDIPLRTLFEAPTVAGLAAAIEDVKRAGVPEAGIPLVPVPREGGLPLSFAQERLWVLNQIEPESAAYNLVAAIRLSGSLDVGALERTLAEIVRRHEALRTIFPSIDGTAGQIILPATAVALPIDDLGFVAADKREAEAERRAAAEAARPFALERDPLFRARLLRLADQEHVLVLTMHHIVSDGWSRGVLYREVAALYGAFSTGRSSPLPELPIQYADFASWQRRWLQADVLEEQLAYWKRHLGGSLPTLDLPTDRPRPPLQTYRGATLSFPLPESLCTALGDVSRGEEATLFMALLAAFQTLLHRYSGQDDIIVGSPSAGRTRLETEQLIGFFVNTLALRTDLSGDPSFRELLARVREVALGAYANQEVPFERVVDAIHPQRDLSRSPLFQVLFILQNTPAHPLVLHGLELRQMDVDAGAAKFDLTLSLVAGAHGYTGHIEYNTDLFDASTVERLAGHYRTLLESVVADPDRPISGLDMLSAGERQLLLDEWNDTSRAVTQGACVHELIEAQAASTPDATAVVFESRSLTYAELDARANQVAWYLRGIGVGRDTLVGMYAERSLEMIVGLLGILKAGAAYVPLDPSYPKDRIGFMIEDAAVPVILTQRRLASRLPAHTARVVRLDADWPAIAAESAESVEPVATSDDLAYVIYTSGSTGKPKGVMVQHRNVVNFFAGMDERVGSDQPGTWLAVTSISFDISVLELFWTLARGYEVVIQGESEGSRGAAARGRAAQRKIGFSLFYFASNENDGAGDKYRLLLEGAKFADRHGFEAVWTPERHFHAFGGLYPSPAVASAAIAAVTEHVKIRSGSVVLPLHNPIRVAEDWSVVDNISKGRVGLAFASGWHDRDFVFAPDNYARRRELMYEQIDVLRRLWRGESITAKGGAGKDHQISMLPRPVQADLPIWITAAGTPETYQTAGRIGANLLTHLLGQSLDQLKDKLAMYRQAWRDAGHPGDGHVSLMLHTFVGTDMETVRETVRVPFRNYLRTSVDLIKGLAEGRGQDIRSSEFTAADMEALLDHAFDRYFGSSALMGTPETCLAMVDQLKDIGVDEIACLIDFGVETEKTLASLELLAQLKEDSEPLPEEAAVPDLPGADYSLPTQLRRNQVTHMQCTPSMASMLSAQPEAREELAGLRTLLIGGEAFPSGLAADLASIVQGRVINMYGPTETTIWSSTHAVDGGGGTVPIGRPIANTTFYIVDRNLNPVPVGVAGELLIGGAGVVRGYLNRPELTAERFVADRFRPDGAGRLYRTGDLARWRADGTVEFLGRLDHQVKVRGHRIELGEIEALVAAHPAVREGIVIAREDVAGDKRLVAYVTLEEGATLADGELRTVLARQLPEYMVPAHVVVLDAMPRTPNLKVDRKALPAPDHAPASVAAMVAPESEIERTIAEIWQDVLRVPSVGIDDNFFDIGGHSLLTVKVHARLRGAIEAGVSITDLFRFPTIRTLAQHLGGAADATRSGVESSSSRAETRRQAMLRRRQRRQPDMPSHDAQDVTQ